MLLVKRKKICAREVVIFFSFYHYHILREKNKQLQGWKRHCVQLSQALQVLTHECEYAQSVLEVILNKEGQQHSSIIGTACSIYIIYPKKIKSLHYTRGFV